jgi:hypothetical protein
MDIRRDLASIFSGEFGAEALLWPGQDKERPVYGHFNQPAHLAELGSGDRTPEPGPHLQGPGR